MGKIALSQEDTSIHFTKLSKLMSNINEVREEIKNQFYELVSSMQYLAG